MDFAGSRYYRIVQIMLICLGLWPYTQRTRYVYSIFLFLLLSSHIFVQLSTFIIVEYNIDLLLNVCSIIGPTIYYALAYFATFISGNKIKELMEHVQYNWNSLKEEEELKIIHNRANIGRFYTIITLICSYTAFFSFLLMFFSPNILNIIMPLNETRQPFWRLTSTMNIFIDLEIYINVELLTLYFFLTLFIGINTLIAAETFLLINVQHACAMFQITSYRIERTVNNYQMKSLTSLEKFSIDKNIVEAIDSHRSATKFIESLKSTFSIAHFFAIPIGVGSLSVNLYRLCSSIMDKDINDTIVLLLFVAAHFGFMFIINYIGQIVIDHSEDTFKKICNTRWYATPLNMQKCLVMIMHRSMKTSTLMFCLGLFLPSLQGFATLISTSLSYFMVIYSMRR